MNLEKRSYKLTGVTTILGGSPADKEVYSNYIASKAPSQVTAQDEIDGLPEEDKGFTVFLREPKEHTVALRDYHVLGFLKEAGEALRSDLGIAQARSKVDRYVFVHPLWLPITKDGKALSEVDGVYERPLRAETMRGPRIALACSEQIEAPWTIDFTVTLLDNPSSKSSAKVTFDCIEEMLSYGQFKGLGQYRNGSFGRFEIERVK